VHPVELGACGLSVFGVEVDDPLGTREVGTQLQDAEDLDRRAVRVRDQVLREAEPVASDGDDLGDRQSSLTTFDVPERLEELRIVLSVNGAEAEASSATVLVDEVVRGRNLGSLPKSGSNALRKWARRR
jgi:hypothetical protein